MTNPNENLRPRGGHQQCDDVERVEMVGGRFAVESAPGKGTIIRAQIPFHNGHRV